MKVPSQVTAVRRADSWVKDLAMFEELGKSLRKVTRTQTTLTWPSSSSSRLLKGDEPEQMLLFFFRSLWDLALASILYEFNLPFIFFLLFFSTQRH